MSQPQSKPITGVRVCHPEYIRMLPKWIRMRDAIAGQDAVKGKGQAYLPPLTEQDDAGFRNYLKRARFFNATWRTVDGIRSMIMRIAPTRNIPAALDAYMDDVTMSGIPLDTLVDQILVEAIGIGRVGALVDHPSAPAEAALTVADAERLGMRPKMALYPAESIRNWRVGVANNAQILTMLVLEETAALPDEQQTSEFTVATETRYRVLDLVPIDGRFVYRQRVFRINDKGEDELVGEPVFPRRNGAPMDRIPFVVFGVDDLTPSVDEPPLIDLADTNLAHYAVTADYERGCHLAATPTPVVSGHTMQNPTDRLLIGSEHAWVFPQPDAKAYFLEFTGAGMDALRDNLADKKSEMATQGARILAATSKQTETATGAAIDAAGENSIAASIANNVSKGVELLLGHFAAWRNVAGEISYRLNTKLTPAAVSPQLLTALMQMWQAGAISLETLFDNLQRNEVIQPDVDFEVEQARIGANPPLALPAMPAPGGAA